MSLTEAMRRSNILTINDQEARQYAETSSLLAAARAIMKNGPSGVIIKKGEHGVIFVSNQGVFGAPALLLEEVKDPTGAGDSFAGGFMGYLAETGDLSFGGLKRALVHGTAVASFTVESLGIDRLASITRDDVQTRYRELLEFTQLRDDRRRRLRRPRGQERKDASCMATTDDYDVKDIGLADRGLLKIEWAGRRCRSSS